MFLAALVVWSSGTDPANPHLSPQGRQALALPTGSAPAPETPASSPTSSGSKKSAKGPLSLLPPLPESTALNAAGPPARSVRMTVESDAAIVQMGYLVKGGHPAKYLDKNVASPAVITTGAHGYGLVAEIGAQASPYATYITCSVTVDGQLHSRHTVHGGWAVAVCIG